MAKQFGDFERHALVGVTSSVARYYVSKHGLGDPSMSERERVEEIADISARVCLDILREYHEWSAH